MDLFLVSVDYFPGIVTKIGLLQNSCLCQDCVKISPPFDVR